MHLSIPLRLLDHGRGLPLPSYATENSAGLDLYAALLSPVVIQPQERLLVPTGFSLAIPKGFEGQVRPRSGLALKHGLTVLNAPGTIDSDYRGELKVLLINLSQEPYNLERGMRIAQLIIAPCCHIEWACETPLSESERNHGGFGSTGY